MFNYHQIESEASEYQQMRRANAEQRWLAARCHSASTSRMQGLALWFGARLVQWGSALQGQTTPSPSSIHTAVQSTP